MKEKVGKIILVIIVVIALIVFGIIMYNLLTEDTKTGEVSGIPTVIPTATPKPTFEPPNNNSGQTVVRPTVTPKPTSSPIGGLGGNTSSDATGSTGEQEYENESEEIADTGEDGIDFTEVQPKTDGLKGYKIISKHVTSSRENGGGGYEIMLDDTSSTVVMSEAKVESIDSWRERVLDRLGFYEYRVSLDFKPGLNPTIKDNKLVGAEIYFNDGIDHSIGVNGAILADGDLSTAVGKACIITVFDEWENPNPVTYAYIVCHGTSFGLTVYNAESTQDACNVIKRLFEEAITSR